ncbi:conserved protein of unknown function [Tenacibaculum sp. 190524A02b]|uniref:hypothetical protein n=1 Tax=Tenacibaculum vairaonense TaxID=3137860 RepID=UPI0032B2CED8
MKKKKEAIRNQILKKVKYYRNSRGIVFLDNPNKQLKEDIVIENNELEVLLIKLKRSRRILVTTKHIYFIDKKEITKILGKNIERFDYMELINGEKIIEGKSKIKKRLLRFKMNFRIGNYRVIQRDGSFTEVTIWKTQLADCLDDCIKALKFVVNKYEAI